MLRIRPAQMDAFADVAQRRFEAAQVRRLLGAPARAVDTEDAAAVLELVRRVVHNALAWGIEEVEEVQQLIDWCRDEGADFHLVEGREELRALLEDPAVAGFAKIDVLREDLFEAEPDARG